MTEGNEKKDRLTGGWKTVIVLAFIFSLAGGGKGERDVRRARAEVDKFQTVIRKMDSRLSALESELAQLKGQ